MLLSACVVRLCNQGHDWCACLLQEGILWLYSWCTAFSKHDSLVLNTEDGQVENKDIYKR